MLSSRCLFVCPVLSVTFVNCRQTVGRIKMKFGVQVGLGPGHIMLDGDPPTLTKGAQPPQFSAHICCGQMAVWMKMSLGMELGLGPGNFVLDGTSLPLPQNGPPNLGALPFLGRGTGSPSNTEFHGQRPTSIPSGILMHPVVCPQ